MLWFVYLQIILDYLDLCNLDIEIRDNTLDLKKLYFWFSHQLVSSYYR